MYTTDVCPPSSLPTLSLFPHSESADKVVSGKGKFEELIVTSKDIAASTAQLVAASKVKARPRSEKLKSLKTSSKSGELIILPCCLCYACTY